MSFHINLFDLYVYRISEEKYNKQRDAFIKSRMTDLEFYREFPECEMQQRVYYLKAFGGMWNYNNIVGFIQLYFYGNQIRGQYVRNDKERNVRNGKKHFIYDDSHKMVPEMWIECSSSNEEILNIIKKYASSCKSELPKGYYIDMSPLLNIGPHIDFRSMLSFKDKPPMSLQESIAVFLEKQRKGS